MNTWNSSIRRGAVSGSLTAVLSALTLGALGKHDSGSAIAPINSVSHWLYGEKAKQQDKASARFTIPGYLTHHISAIFWAVLFERFAGRLLDRKDPVATLEAAAATSAIACFVDYKLTPQRLQPGFEARLTRTSMVGVYAAIGLGLALGAMLVRRD